MRDAKSVARLGSSVVLLVAFCRAEPASAYELYSFPEDVPFALSIPGSGEVVRGTFRAATASEILGWDLTSAGQDAGASAGVHACADLGFNPFANCPFTDEVVGCQADGLVFRLELDGDSNPVSQVGPALSPPVATAFGGSAYIISASAAERVPVSSSSGAFQFHTSNDPAVFIQPGESTVWLLSRYQCGSLGDALGAGLSVRMEVRDNSVLTGIQFANTPELELVRVFPTVTTTTLGPPGGICGDPVDPFPTSITAGRTVTASDALFTLQAAVKTVSCELCVCDVNGSGSITAGDALFLLQRAVGQPVEFDCPPCL